MCFSQRFRKLFLHIKGFLSTLFIPFWNMLKRAERHHSIVKGRFFASQILPSSLERHGNSSIKRVQPSRVSHPYETWSFAKRSVSYQAFLLCFSKINAFKNFTLRRNYCWSNRSDLVVQSKTNGEIKEADERTISLSEMFSLQRPHPRFLKASGEHSCSFSQTLGAANVLRTVGTIIAYSRLESS